MAGSISYKEYNEKYRLPEQERDEKLIMKHKHFILCYEPGKGKSYPAIHCMVEINKLKKGQAKVLILSDATCIRDMWKKDIMPQGIMPKNTYLVTDRTAIGAVKEALINTDWDLIICDECQSLRSGVTRAKSKYAKLVYQLTRKAEYVIGMTGTIAGNNDIEPFCVLHNLNVAGMGKVNCHAFKNVCCVKELQYGPFGAFQKPVRLNERGLEMMQKAYQEGCSFWDYDDNDGMPPMDISFKSFPVKATQTYKDALDGILKCGEFESTTLKAIAMQKAQQSLNGFLYYDVDGVRQTFCIEDFVNPKLDYIVQECLKENHIIAYRYQEDAVRIKEVLTKNKIAYCEQISEFKRRLANKEHIVLVLQCSRGKAANIQDCQNIIYYTADFSFISFKQFIHRCWRRGQTSPCKVTFLCNDPSDTYKVEYKIWDSLRKKKNIHEMLMSIKQDGGVD